MAEPYTEELLQLDENAILAQINNIAQELGIIKEVFTTSRIYIHYAVFSRVLGNLTQIIAQYYENLDFDNITDEALLDMLIDPFIQKKNARVSKVILEFSRRDDFLGEKEDILIPREFEVMTEGENPIIFRTAEARFLWKDSYRVLIPAYSIEFGSINNVAPDTLIYFDDNEYFNQVQVTNLYPAFGGSDEETSFDTRNRIELFRYGRDSTKDAIMDLLYENGVSFYASNIIEYYEGFGTVLICMDVDSEEEFNDIVAVMESQKPGGVKYHYCMAEYIYININVIVKMIIEKAYTPYEKNEIEEHIRDATETFFANQIYVGRKLSVNRLESYILQYLIDERYDIYEIEIDIDNNADLTVDAETGQLKIEEFQRLYPNAIYTTIEYTTDE